MHCIVSDLKVVLVGNLCFNIIQWHKIVIGRELCYFKEITSCDDMFFYFLKRDVSLSLVKNI